MGGSEGPARAAVEMALDHGTSVVTANKALLAHHGADLARRAEAHGAALNFEASVAGGIPIIKTLREGLVGNRVSKLFGIMNGTCNYILTKMANEGRSFADVLKEAQALGYAEADPTFDVGGFDTAHKLAVLTSLAFGTEVNLRLSTSRASRRSPLMIFAMPVSLATRSSCWASPCCMTQGSNSACTRRWCPRARPSPIPMACSTPSW